MCKELSVERRAELEEEARHMNHGDKMVVTLLLGLFGRRKHSPPEVSKKTGKSVPEIHDIRDRFLGAKRRRERAAERRVAKVAQTPPAA